MIAHAVWLYLHFRSACAWSRICLQLVGLSFRTRPCGYGRNGSGEISPAKSADERQAGTVTNGTSMQPSSPASNIVRTKARTTGRRILTNRPGDENGSLRASSQPDISSVSFQFMTLLLTFFTFHATRSHQTIIAKCEAPPCRCGMKSHARELHKQNRRARFLQMSVKFTVLFWQFSRGS